MLFALQKRSKSLAVTARHRGKAVDWYADFSDVMANVLLSVWHAEQKLRRELVLS